MPPFLQLRQIVKRFPGVLANDHIDFTVEAGEIHALLGENGAGKSTLMQILYGLYQRDGGDILINGEAVEIHNPRDAIALGIGMIHQEFMLVPRFSVVENVVLGIAEDGKGPLLDLKGAARRLTELSRQHGLEIDPLAKIEHLPIGVQQRVEILKLLYRHAKLLILDEPTAVLTPQESQNLFKVLRALAGQGHAVILITHKLHEVMAIADRVTVLRDGRATGTLATSDTSARELARLMVGREIAPSEKPAQAPGKPILEARQLHVADEAGRFKLQGLDITLHAGEILGLAGVDGNGQSELAEALMNLRPIRAGQVLLDGLDLTHASPAAHRAAGMAYIPADRRNVGSVGPLSIAHNAVLGNVFDYLGRGKLLLDQRRVRRHAATLVERYDVRAPGIQFAAGKLSGGNLQKVVLGREVMRNPQVLIVEQPTRGLDIGASEYVRGQLLAERARGAAILLISAELEEILALSDRIAVLYQGRIMGILDGANADLETIGLLMAGTRDEPPGAVRHG
ncbi:MAG: ABC transporter ATP-binding protein [Gammaproteobacteria bacterium]